MNPNPFDFVPFSQRPNLFTRQELDKLGPPVTGYLELRLHTLTPLHVVGRQTSSNDGNAGHSYFFRQGEQPCIPASSMRGCLRAFIEALTSGWVSKVNSEYKRSHSQRHVGFSAFGPSSSHTLYGIDSSFQPQLREDGKLDVASYLFGVVLESTQAAEFNAEQPETGDRVAGTLRTESSTRANHHAESAHKSKLAIEDAYFQDDSLRDGHDWMPDIAGEAFMGGGKPSASSWWYFQPREIRRRVVDGLDYAEFIGDRFWGRKFYFHQNPGTCIEYYDRNWPFGKGQKRKVWLECVRPTTASAPFRIYVDAVPEPLVKLLIKSLAPNNSIRHKLGYAKACGYGSIAFELLAAKVRINDNSTRVPPPLMDVTSALQGWSRLPWDVLGEHGIDANIIDINALQSLATILGWHGAGQVVHTYPPFDSTNFRGSLRYAEVESVLSGLGIGSTSAPTPITAAQARAIAERLFNRKRTIHFRYYQEQAESWTIISSRKP